MLFKKAISPWKFTLFLLLSSLSLFAQEHTVKVSHIGIEEGLLHRRVRALYEDNNGYLWIGGTKGIQRYDGHEFKSWTRSNKSGLLYHISRIIQDDAGWLWLWNTDQLTFVFLHPETEEVLTAEERFPHMPIVQEKGAMQTFLSMDKLGQGKESKLVFGMSDGNIITYNTHQGFDTIQVNNQKIPTDIKLIDQDNNFWATSHKNFNPKHLKNSELACISPEGKVLRKYEFDDQKLVPDLNIQDDEITFITRSEYETNIELFKFEKDNSITHIPTDKEYQGHTIIKNSHWLWKESNGISVYSKSFDKVIHSFELGEGYDRMFDGMFQTMVDSRGIIWLYNAFGLYKIDFYKNKFKNYLAFDQSAPKPFANSTRGFIVEDDSIYINCELSGTFALNKLNPKEYKKISDQLWARPMLKSKDNNFIIGYPFHISETTTSGKTLREFHSATGKTEFSGTWSFHLDQRDKLWIASGTELIYKESDSDHIKNYQSKDDPWGFTSKRGAIQNIIPFKDDLVWFCSWTGLYLFDTKTEKVISRFASDEQGDNYLPALLFYYVYQDDQNIFWIGTSEGLIKWAGPDSSTSSDPFKLFTRLDGLSNDVIYAIFEDDYNRIWMSSDYGIMSLNKETEVVQIYLEEDGISHHEFNRTSQAKDQDGNIYFGGLNGITSFNPKAFVHDQQDHARMLISDFEIFDGTEKKLINRSSDLRLTKTIHFQPKDRFFRLKFTLPTFEEDSQKLYAWKIAGLNDNWNYQKENVLQIGILPYGLQKLIIKGGSAGSGWSPHEIEIDIMVHKPFYLQTWFLILMTLLSFLAIASFISIRLRKYKRDKIELQNRIETATIQIRSQAEELKKLDKLKSRFFANVSHELRTPLSMMIGPINNLQKFIGYEEKEIKMLQFLKRNTLLLKGLVNEILDLSKLENNKMELQEEPIAFYGYLQNHLTQFYSFGSSESINFRSEFPVGPELFVLLDTNKFEKIINNYLSNAMKFTDSGGTVKVQVSDLGSDILLCVQDSGRGIHPNDLDHVFNRFYQSKQEDAPVEGGTGIGLSLCKELAELMEGKVWVESKLGIGSKFYVQIKKKLTSEKPKNQDPFTASIDEPIKAQSPAVKDTVEQVKKLSSGSHILIVEDNEDLRAYYEIILSDYKIKSSIHGKEAIDYLNKTKHLPDLIITDLMMPVMDGMQFIEVLKSSDLWRHIPVIMLTAKTNRFVRIKALRIGIDDYITKPFDDEELIVRIHNMLANTSSRNSNLTNDISEQSISGPRTTKEELEWLESIEVFINKNMDNDLLTIDLLLSEFAISQSTLHRQIKKITGLSPAKYIQEHRLNFARQLLENKTYRTVAQVSAKIGFRDPNSFSRSFKSRYGVTPKSLLAE